MTNCWKSTSDWIESAIIHADIQPVSATRPMILRTAYLIIGIGWWWLQTIYTAFMLELPVYVTAIGTTIIWLALVAVIGALCVRFNELKTGFGKFRLSTLVLVTLFLSIHFAIGRLILEYTTDKNFAQELQPEDIIMNLTIFGGFVGITTLIQLLFAESIVFMVNRMRKAA
ncbi:MAG: hypothetical protein AAF497_27515 [Planctomycetota bacterium]